MMAIGTRKIGDREVMEALMPGSVNDNDEDWSWPEQGSAISIMGLTPGVAFDLAECCHPVPGDRIVGLRRSGENVEVHAIDCFKLADGVDADWVDLSWGQDSATAQRLGLLSCCMTNPEHWRKWPEYSVSTMPISCASE